MTINKIDVDKNEATLSFNRHDILVIHRALTRIYEELTEEDKFLHLEINGVDDILKDGNFTRFLGFHRNLVEDEIHQKTKENRIKCESCGEYLTGNDIFISNGIPYCKKCNKVVFVAGK